MAIEADLRQALSGLFGDRIFPDVAPPDVGLPFSTYQQIGGQPLNFLAGVPDKENGRFQLNIWSDDREQASQLMREARKIMCLHPALLATIMTGVLARYEPETKLYGAQQDFSIWFDA
ncbi:DUF3168 domain-containing protein [Cupriavidus sp. WS]|uniref:DUF3168 domain-containing protein n=1 Tax=Cupriavidus sp. WS TaxID=1312922 RepID=UPI0004908628|nr:DUF3168 domain-containing protein [Cupriavidus sp. WS]